MVSRRGQQRQHKKARSKEPVSLYWRAPENPSPNAFLFLDLPSILSVFFRNDDVEEEEEEQKEAVNVKGEKEKEEADMVKMMITTVV